MTPKTRQVACPICHHVNEVEDLTVGCYVLCSRCPHRFYVEAPVLGDSRDSNVARTPPNVLPDFTAVQQLITSQDQGARRLMDALTWQKPLLMMILCGQILTAALLLVVIYLLARNG